MVTLTYADVAQNEQLNVPIVTDRVDEQLFVVPEFHSQNPSLIATLFVQELRAALPQTFADHTTQP